MTIEIDGLNLDGLGNLANILEASPDCVKIAEYLASGMNGVVEKPIDIGKLYAAIDHTLPRP